MVVVSAFEEPLPLPFQVENRYVSLVVTGACATGVVGHVVPVQPLAHSRRVCPAANPGPSCDASKFTGVYPTVVALPWLVSCTPISNPGEIPTTRSGASPAIVVTASFTKNAVTGLP